MYIDSLSTKVALKWYYVSLNWHNMSVAHNIQQSSRCAIADNSNIYIYY